MNYRHGFHAGNFADVVKHSLLLLLLEALVRKPAPLAYFDTHSGAGAYDLRGSPAQRTGEALEGIGRLWPARGRLPAAAERLCDIVSRLDPGAASESMPRLYPGSPWVASAVTRTTDRLILAELHPEEAEALKAEFRRDARTAVHQRDGYEMLQALTPPKERRGLVLIDPPYEKSDEFEQAAAALLAAHTRWPGGVYGLWYPIKDDSARRRFLRRVENSGLRKVLLAELQLPERAEALSGTGMLIVNPPWQLDETIRATLQGLLPILSPDGGSTEIRWLVPE